MHQTPPLSPFVTNVLKSNGLELLEVLRYGPRFVCCRVKSGDVEGMFKMVLPIEERADFSARDYVWTEYDDVELLEKRLLKEALFLQFMASELGEDGYEPQIIAISETSPVWSLRTFIKERTMAAWGSDFIFSPRFYETFEPADPIHFFSRMHALSDRLPQNLTSLISDYVSTLTKPGRYEYTVARAAGNPRFASQASRIKVAFERNRQAYSEYQKVITHYEPYPPHIFSSGGQMGLIDWENVGWGHKLQDVSVLYMRCLAEPQWQAKYVSLLQRGGYFEGHGRLYWDSELLIQAFANYRYFAEGGPIGTPEFDQKAVAFFNDTIEQILEESPYFKA